MTTNEAFQLALAHHQAGRLGEAERFYRAAVAADVKHAPAWHNLGVILEERGELAGAIDVYRSACAAAPASVESHFNLANALTAAGRLGEAIASFSAALRLAPYRFDIHGDFGTALRLNGRIDEALAEHRRAVELGPGSAEARANLGLTQLKKGLSDDAVATLTEALRLKPVLAIARYNLGNALKVQGPIGEAIEAYRRAAADAPSGDPVAHDNLIFAMYHDAACDLASIRAEEQRWAEKFEQPLRKIHRPHDNDRDPERRLRVAYVSPDFSDHAHAFYLVPLLANHDREAVEAICYSSVANPDAVTARIRSHASEWRDVAGLSDEQLAELMRRDRIDIAVDLSMHLGGNRLLLFARKPAPVQVTWLAYTAGTGMESIDCRLTDPHLDPPGAERDARYAEQSVRLPETFWCYDPIVRDAPVNALPAKVNGYVTFGCLNNFSKVNVATLRLWAGVIRATPRSRMVILCDPGSARGRTIEAFGAQGVDASRIELVPRQPRPQYLATHHRIDVMLDTFPFNGHTTSFDALWMGVPVVSLCGETSVSRGGLSIMTNLGLAERFVARDEAAFTKLAVECAGDIDALARVRATLRERMESSALMEAARFARAFESALREMWRAWCRRG